MLTLKVPVHHKPTFGRHEEIARRPVPTFSGPTENDFLAARKAVFGLTTIGASTKKEANKQRSYPVPRKGGRKGNKQQLHRVDLEGVSNATGYQVEMRRFSKRLFHSVCEGNSLKCTAASLEPNTKCLLHGLWEW